MTESTAGLSFEKICQLRLPLTAPLEHPYLQHCFTMFHICPNVYYIHSIQFNLFSSSDLWNASAYVTRSSDFALQFRLVLASSTENASYFCQYIIILKKIFRQFTKEIFKIYYEYNTLMPNNGSGWFSWAETFYNYSNHKKVLKNKIKKSLLPL